MVPPYGYNSRKNTFLPPYSHAVLTSMEYTHPRSAIRLTPPLEVHSGVCGLSVFRLWLGRV
jgi:hypothetical protein